MRMALKLKWAALLGTTALVSNAFGEEEGANTGNTQRQRSPNIVILIIDDAGTQDLGFSSKLQMEMMKVKVKDKKVEPFDVSPIRTPFIDSLAEESILFPQYYTHPTCTPSRSALMTGKYAFMNGLPFPIAGTSMIGLDPSSKTIANYFQEAGYATHMVGKWHLGHAKDIYRPPRRGFDTFLGCVGGAIDHYTKSIPGCIDLWNTTEANSSKMTQFSEAEIDTTQHATDLFSDEAIRLINAHAATSSQSQQPFFLYLSYTSPHAPLQADEAYTNSPECRLVPNKTRRLFCAMMLQLDRGVERVVTAMKTNGMWDDTYFVFTTDNGGMPVVGGFNYPFRGSKLEAWEGGVRGPAFFRCPPGRNMNPIKNGLYHGLVHIADWLPTLMSATGIDAEVGDIDGIDHFAAFQTQLVASGSQDADSVPPLSSFPRTTVIPQADIFLNVTAVRQGCHKLILGPPGYNHVFQEPNEHLFNNVSRLHSFFEAAFPVVEAMPGIPSFTVQFYKYVLQNMVEVTEAELQKTKYYFDPHTFVKTRQRDYSGDDTKSIVTASYKEDPITVQWDSHPGPLVFLFNVCDDPSESDNLAQKQTHEGDVERLYQVLAHETAKAPVQFAGDVILSGMSTNEGAQCIPFLQDDTNILLADHDDDEGSKSSALDPQFVQEYGTAIRLFLVTLRDIKRRSVNAAISFLLLLAKKQV
jgi:arylsulfatase A-like enzyme